MRFFLGTCSLLLCCVPALAEQWDDPDLGHSVIEGVADVDYLWLRGASGRLVRFDRRTGERMILGEGVIDLLPTNANLWALSKDQRSQDLTVTDLRSASPLIDPFYVQGEPIGLFLVERSLPGVLTTRAFAILEGDDWVSQTLPSTLDDAGIVTSSTDGTIYVGLNRGEWGGGLRRIDPSGTISFVTTRGEDICGGLLNPNCDPVVGLFRDPDHDGCVLVGTGLAHMILSKGTVWRVCDGQISPLFSALKPEVPGYIHIPENTWAFSSLTQTNDGWIAVSQRRYFQAHGDSSVAEEHVIPQLSDWSGIRISAEDPSVLFVMRDCCWGLASNPTEFGVLAIPVQTWVGSD